MLGREPDRAVLVDHGREHGDHRHLVGPVEIEALGPAQAVEPPRGEAGLLVELPERRVERTLARLDPAVDRFPGAGAARARSPAEEERLPGTLPPPEDVEIDERNPDCRQTRRPGGGKAWS
jgi:hypothetical protein